MLMEKLEAEYACVCDLQLNLCTCLGFKEAVASMSLERGILFLQAIAEHSSCTQGLQADLASILSAAQHLTRIHALHSTLSVAPTQEDGSVFHDDIFVRMTDEDIQVHNREVEARADEATHHHHHHAADKEASVGASIETS